MKQILKPIGRLYRGESISIQLDMRYIKAMQNITCFSHIHVFYDEENRLNKAILRIIESSDKIGLITAENRECLPNKADVFDIKPYIPSEDSVYGAYSDKNAIDIELLSEGMRLLALQKGRVKNSGGSIYIEMNCDIAHISASYLKIYWWFDKFDSVAYRSITQCDPPYENAPKSGIFLTRSPVRPNPLAFTVIKVKKYDYENKRIYPMSLEAFDGTPCLGIEEYHSGSDLIEGVRVPQHMAHWADRLDERDMFAEQDNITIHDSALIKILNKPAAERKEKAVCAPKKDGIWVRNARVNNLKDIDAFIPYNQITAVVGVSGSGKSSLVSDTVYAECRRRMEYLSNNRDLMPKPDVDDISGAIPAMMVSQRSIRGNSMSTVGTYTDSFRHLRVLYSLAGIRHCPDCGNEIIPLTKEKIHSIIDEHGITEVFSLGGQPVNDIDKALSTGAVYAEYGGERLMLQTKQMCFRCGRMMFELTPSTFSYMDSESRCPVCGGIGQVIQVDEEKLVGNADLSILDGALPFYGSLRDFLRSPNANWMKGQVFGMFSCFGVDPERPWKELPDELRHAIIHGMDAEVSFSYTNGKNGRSGEITRRPEGLKGTIERLYGENSGMRLLESYMKRVNCAACKGERLNKQGRMVTLLGVRYPEAAGLSFEELKRFCERLRNELPAEQYIKTKSSIDAIMDIADTAIELGIGYIGQSRGTATLSNGEAGRLKLLSAFVNHMSGILYVLDEPSKGLDPQDYGNVAAMLRRLKEENNTVLMVEHNPDMIKCADNLIEIGPGPGSMGGSVVSQGKYADVLRDENSLTNSFMGQADRRILKRRQMGEFVELSGLNEVNLKNIGIRFPKHVLTCICGRSGSGKTTLLKREIYPRMKASRQFRRVIMADQAPIGKTSKSVVATYMGLMDILRELMAGTEEARELGLDASCFSFNSEMGKCPACKGEGRTAVKYLDNLYLKCPDCKGKRYKKEVLRARLNGMNMSEILDMAVDTAAEFLRDSSEALTILGQLRMVGLGYLRLGQATATLSGGEAQRLRLAAELRGNTKGNTLFLLDEPTMGLHFSDIQAMLRLMERLLDEGNTVVAIEHNRQFVVNCDYVIELGPGAGKDGGMVIRQGRTDE